MTSIDSGDRASRQSREGKGKANPAPAPVNLDEIEQTVVSAGSRDNQKQASGISFANPQVLGSQQAEKSGITERDSGRLGLIGKVIDKRFRIIAKLGRGGMGDVYKAEHLVLQQFVALKILHAHQLNQTSGVERFQQEAKAISSLDHPNVVRVFAFGQAEETFYMAMDYLQGRSLYEILEEEGKLSWQRVLHICLQICDGLGHAHERGVIHRDLKPSNIIILQDEEGKETAKIVDFGVARLTPDSGKEQKQLTLEGNTCGSPPYMSPEQCMGEPVDCRSDIYSLACMIYELLSGKRPFYGGSTLELMQKHVEQSAKSLKVLDSSLDLPASFEAIIRKCLHKKPELRYQSMKELQDDLRVVGSKSASEAALVKYGEQKRSLLQGRLPLLAFSTVGLALAMVFLFSNLLPQIKLAQLKEELASVPSEDPQVVLRAFGPLSELVSIHSKNGQRREALASLKSFEKKILQLPLTEKKFSLLDKLARVYGRLGNKGDARRLQVGALSGLELYMERCDAEKRAVEFEQAFFEYMRLAKDDKSRFDQILIKLNILFSYRLNRKEYPEAEAIARKGLSIARQGNNPGALLVILSFLANSLMPQEKFAEAESSLKEAFDLCIKYGWQDMKRKMGNSLIDCYLAQGKKDAATKTRQLLAESH